MAADIEEKDHHIERNGGGVLSGEISRSHLKKNDHKKNDDIDEIDLNEKQDGDDVLRDKVITNELNLENKKDLISDHGHISDAATNICKRNFSDIEEDECEESDELRKKKRKDSDGGKETKTIPNLRLPARADKSTKQTTTAKNLPVVSKSSNLLEIGTTECTRINFNKTLENDGEDDDFKIAENMYSGGLKVPPLKIVIPQQNCSIDTEGNVSRTGKVNASRNAALPYVVSSSNESNERDTSAPCGSPQESPLKFNAICAAIEEKNIKLLNEEKNLHRVLRSSHKTGVSSVERSSNNSSPQMQSSSPSPASSNANEAMDGKANLPNLAISPLQQNQTFDNENLINLPSPSTSSTSSLKDTHSTVELHPRKRKIRSKNDDSHLKGQTTNSLSGDAPTISDSHPHDFPFTNCFQMYLNIRRQIEKKWKNLYPVKPRPPQGFHEYLINKRTYLLSENKVDNEINIPSTVSLKMRDIFLIQVKERKELFQRHTVEREKLCLNVEQEIIRVHSKAARNISSQSAPYSVCTLLKDEEVYNLITPEQEEKDRNARYRFNGRLLLSWLQDVDDKWEKIKESLVLRHHNEAESLHAVQLMDWEIALKRYDLCDYKSKFIIDMDHVPIVPVSDDFDLLPA